MDVHRGVVRTPGLQELLHGRRIRGDHAPPTWQDMVLYGGVRPEFFSLWYDIVEDYTTQRFTVADDRLYVLRSTIDLHGNGTWCGSLF